MAGSGNYMISAYLLLVLGMVIFYAQYIDGVLDWTPLECATHDDARDYMGTDPVTGTGKECVIWTEQTITAQYLNVDLFPDVDLADADNHCRNPINYKDDKPEKKTWCYKETGLIKWEWCAFPERCSDCKDDTVGSSYSGTVSSTSCGITCQRWDSQSPHPHTYTEHTYFPDSTLEFAENYCRNPDDARAAPWCYTTDDAVEWEYCNVDLCENPEGGSLCGVDLEPQQTTVRVRETTIPLTEPLETTTAAETTVPTTTTERETTTPEPPNETIEPADEAAEPMVEVTDPAGEVTDPEGEVTDPEGEVTDPAEEATQPMGVMATEPIGGATQPGATGTEPEVATESGGFVSDLAVGTTQHGGLVSELIGAVTEPVVGMSHTEGLNNTEHAFNTTNALESVTAYQGITGDAVSTEASDHVSQAKIVTYVPSIPGTGQATNVETPRDIKTTGEVKEIGITHDQETTATTRTTVRRTISKSTKAASMIETTETGSVVTDVVYDEDYYEADMTEEKDMLPIYLAIGTVAFELSIAIPCFIMYFKNTRNIKPMEA